MTKPPPTVAVPTSASISRDLVAERILDDLQARRAEREGRLQARQRRRLRQKRLRRLIVLTVPFLLALAWGERPGRVEVEGHTVWAWRTTTVARAVEKAGVQPAWGDLVDVRGQTLARGFGSPPTPMAGGRPISYAAPARAYRSISLQAGADRREATYERATLLPAPRDEDEWAAGGKRAYLAANTSVCGVSRRELGSLSGLPAVVEQAIALPIAAAGAAVHAPKRLALTFDDGPNGDTSREILSILRAHNAKATFFLRAECVAGGRDVIAQEVAEGHEIGNHSWHHPKMTRMAVSAAVANIERAESAIGAAAESRCRWFRPPYGETTARLRKAILEAGYNIALWSVDTRDWQRPGADTIYRRIMAGAKPGAIILLHDGGGDRRQTVAACRQAIPELVGQGYELVTLSELQMSVLDGDGGVMLFTDEGVRRAHVPGEPIHVVVGGRELPDVQPVLAMAGRILLPAPTILDALGADWEWDAEAQTVTVSSLRGRFRLRMDSERVQWDDREVRLEVPPILYHDVPLVPAQALARTTGARFDKSYDPMTLRFSFAEPVFSPRPAP